jgi:predicted NUDIX family NTP pyrophosphohydrolase
MPETSAGIMLYRRTGKALEVLLVHPGGPFWAKKDDGAWTIPKGLYESGEEPEAAARREFAEETGYAPAGEMLDLGSFRQPSGKRIMAFALEGDFEPDRLVSNTFEMEWPPRSGKRQSFPEIDRAGWFGIAAARVKLLKGQVPILEALLERLAKQI